jgi:hypothetical protein
MNYDLSEKINILIAETNALLPLADEYENSKNKGQLPGFLGIHARIKQFLQQAFGVESSYFKEFQNHEPSFHRPHYRVIKDYKELLNAIYLDIKCDLLSSSKPISTEIILDYVFNNFSLFYQQIQKRYNKRKTIEITDEYDVQDIVHSILRLFLSDIRKEAYNPQHLGKSTKIDFVLYEENIGIEIKYADGINPEKRIGDELLVDINHYKMNRNCKKLYCFIYNPHGAFNNPHGFIKELEESKELPIRVYIKP